MKRFWLVLLSLGLFMAFSVSAYAVDIKVGAEYYAAGLYLNKTSVNAGYDDDPYDNPSTAFFFQRLRVGTDFIVSPCLKLVTRFDAMERIWGGARSSGVDAYTPPEFLQESWSAGSRAENENIAFDVAYIAYTSPIGLFEVGYMPDYDFGTVFADMGEKMYNGQIKYFIQKGPFIGFLGYSKVYEKNTSYVPSSYPAVDTDYNSYRIAGIYKFNSAQAKGEVGGLLLYDRNALYKGGFSPIVIHTPGPTFNPNLLQNIYVLDPYVKAKIGPVDVQAEVLYYFGDAAKWEDGFPVNNVSISALSAFVDANANFGMFNVGGSIAYLSGDNPDTADKLEGSGAAYAVNNGGWNYNPCLILFNTETTAYWVGPITGHTNSVVNNPMSNAWFLQGRVGVKPTAQWDINLALSYAFADRKPQNPANNSANYPYQSHNTYAGGIYGTEVDLTATYKITNNLSYMLGAGYLFTGDYFKGFDRAGQGYEIDNDYLLINKLTLSF